MMFLTCALSYDGHFNSADACDVFLALGDRVIDTSLLAKHMVGRFCDWEEFQQEMTNGDRRIVLADVLAIVLKDPLDEFTHSISN